MTLIDGDRIITAQLYDDQHEEFTEKKMSIIEYINAYTDEGVTVSDVVEQTDVPVTNVGDLISRQAVIDTIETDCSWDIFNEWGSRTPTGECIINAIKSVPSVEVEKCGDCISRQAAIDAVRTDYFNVWRSLPPMGYRAIKAIERVPSVEPERKPGKWIWDKRTGTYHCSECGHDPLHEDVGEIEEYKYCMNCGAKMEVDR